MKLTLDGKLKFVKMHLDDNVPFSEIRKKYSFRKETIKHNECGLAIFSVKKLIKRYQKFNDKHSLLKVTKVIRLLCLFYTSGVSSKNVIADA